MRLISKNLRNRPRRITVVLFDERGKIIECHYLSKYGRSRSFVKRQRYNPDDDCSSSE
jgi:hypothetical protein